MSSASPEPQKPGPDRRNTSRLNGPLLAVAVVVLVGVGFLAARHYLGMPPVFIAQSTSREGTGTPAAAGKEAAPAVAGREGADAIGGPFTLVDQDGKTVTDADFRGRWMLVYFGFTFCPDICPTSLARNGDALDLLGPQADKITPVLISVDPERDTPAKMKDYVHFFHPRTVGLTGSPEQIAAVTREYRVFYMKSPGNTPDTYQVDHSSLTYLVGPDGRFVQFFRHETSAQEMADKLKSML
ncbi:MAG TPA: SCO family protein [Rhodospirillales bacterium]|nr:SCO family protein [Rhodospirillales bacterium]